MTAILKLRRVLLLLALFLLPLGCDDEGGADPEPATDAEVEVDEGDEPDEDVDIEIDAAVDAVVDAVVDAEIDAAPPCVCGEEGCEDTETCTSVEVCERDEQCAGALICEESACVEGCADDSGCLNTPETPACFEARCVACVEDAHCAGAQVCNPETKVCDEPETCETHGDCFEGRVCNGNCEDAFNCALDAFSCPGELVCNQDTGECAPASGDCDSDEACGLYEICGNNGCELCDRDSDCPGDQVCLEGRCLEAEECSADEDCWGDRVCDGGACEAPTCSDDDLEGNQSLEDAVSLSERAYRGLMSCAPDFFSVTLTQGQTATALVRQHSRSFNLALNAYDEAGDLLSHADTGSLVEALILGPYPADKTVIIEVTQAAFAGGEYDIELYIHGDEECVDDAGEFGAGDDTALTGPFIRARNELGFGEPISQRMCAGDDDYVCFYLGREELTVRAEIVLGNPTLKASLYDEDGELVEGAEGSWVRGGETDNLQYSNRSQGEFCLRFYAEEGAGTYRLNLTAISTSALAACEASEFIDQFPFAPTSATLEGSSGLQASCGASDAAEGIYAFSTDQPQLLVARVTGRASGTLGDPVLSVRGECALGTTELGCASNYYEPDHALFPLLNPVELRVGLLEAGDYTLIVDGNQPVGEQAEYTIEADLLPLPAAPQNDLCEAAEALELDPNGMTEVDLNLGRATDDVMGCFGEGAPDATYQVEIPENARVRVQATADFAVGAYLVSDCDGVSPVACGYGFDQEIPAGTYYLVVDGANHNSRGRVTVRVEIDSVSDAPANEDCGSAEALGAAGEWMAGTTRAAADDYTLDHGNACTGHNSASADVAYTLATDAGARVYVEAAPDMGWDLSLYAASNCSSLNQCAAGSDGALTETLVFTMPQAEVNIIVDGSNGEEGDFQIRWGLVECESDDECEGACVEYTCVNE